MSLSVQDTNRVGVKHVYFENGVYIGDFVVAEDGYWVYFPENKGGSWDEYILRLLLDKLCEMNKPWDEEVNKYFDEQRDDQV
jgi:hypothetical protein